MDEPQDSHARSANARAGAHRADDPSGLGSIFEDLTEAQKQAVAHTEGPLLVLAGPGSGKTRVITRRIAYLVSCGIPPWQTLAVTFTNKAAAEMRDRVHRLLGDGAPVRGLTATTFHALCARLLRKYADAAAPGLLGVSGTFAIYDTDDQTALVKRAVATLDLSPSNWPPRSVLSRISAAKNDLEDAAAFAGRASTFADRTVAKVYTEYQRSLRAANAVDFDDLLLLTVKLLRSSPQVLAACRDRWRYLLIDEYQDTNKAQFAIASLIAAGTSSDQNGGKGLPPNICVVGDPDQSIYGWRGADITNILRFEDQFPGAAVIPLGENFRSTGHIIGAADALIRRNTQRKHKDLFTSNSPGKPVEVVHCRDEHHEARLVVDWIRNGAAGDGPSAGSWRDFAVFYRTNALSRVVEDELRREGIPYTIVRGTAFYEREEIRNAVAYLRVVANPADSVSLERIVNTPARGIGDTTVARVRALAAERDIPMLEALRAAGPTIGLPQRTAGAIANLVAMLDAWAGIHEPGMLTTPAEAGSLADLVGRVIRESGLEAMYRKEAGDTEIARLDNLDELVSSAREFEDDYDPSADPAGDAPLDPGADVPPPSLLQLLRAYLERIALVADADAVDTAGGGGGSVTLMTLHAAKGLEFPSVAMIGLEEDLLPHARVREMPEQLEEERRLCFVGITRAQTRLLITSARYRTIRGVPQRTIPSRFIEELPPAHASVRDQSGYNEPGWDDESPSPGGAGEIRFERDEDPAAPSGRGRSPAAKDSRGNPLAVGVMVRHPQFGLGRISSITGGRDARAQISFRQVGSKTLVLQYARLERVEG